MSHLVKSLASLITFRGKQNSKITPAILSFWYCVSFKEFFISSELPIIGIKLFKFTILISFLYIESRGTSSFSFLISIICVFSFFFSGHGGYKFIYSIDFLKVVALMLLILSLLCFLFHVFFSDLYFLYFGGLIALLVSSG